MNDSEILDNYFYLTFLGEIIRIAVFSELWVNIVTGGSILTYVYAMILSWVSLGVFGALQTYRKQQMFSKLKYGVCINKTMQAYIIHKSSVRLGRRIQMSGTEMMVFHITAWSSRIVFGAICGIFSYSYSKQNKKIEVGVDEISVYLGLININHRENKKDVK